MRLGVFGGTFDPPHLGHLIVAQDAHARLSLDRVLFVPAAIPPHKRDRPQSPAALRLEMVRAAVAADPRFAVDDLELCRAGPSYTVDTLRELRRRDPDAELFLLLGADQARDFGTWREPHEIARLATLVLLTRAGVSATAPGHDAAAIRLEVTRIDISSTDVRRRAAAGEPIRYLVPEGVEAIIRREGLYGTRA